MEINITNQSSQKKWSRYKKDFLLIAQRAQEVLKLEDEYSMSVIFVDPEEIHEINKTYRNIDRPTDVISFALRDEADDYEMMEEDNELGDIFINIQAIVDQASEYGHSMRREVCFLFTHGLLHLLGYDHMCEEDEKQMFALQDVILDDIVPKKIRK
ncbi:MULTISPECIES: rRNA maturation RNase YbeY [Bacillota]|jgi:probable rRNA maturation factor|uniref:Endoribonuclease YbeY n=2 Tax=Amedibacillus TaxID=2749846 RepID=A0A7G9GMD3_9FIRM|nr:MULTISPECIES: rRNA maturation RNase YbeY [Bacillota]QNM11965.1 rRNA maturation RNase YbeY [[Eubacterium] hominis]MCH4287284.1 rRNA maturation RNase YbeY [Amedibacillus hominis]RGB50844.1 rRNA maturation RNase YbeY [Absiella sp. AM22-9]RGB56444.1 rRNA maturation RNase YbeY [Absiella sp. AM10-20]RGB64523.1 rRNA maturation RNase YbeY [Absiella sp. AM09-45]